MQRRIDSPDVARPAEHFRITDPYFDVARSAGLTAVNRRTTIGHAVSRRHGILESRRQTIDFVRCSYLGLDDHPVIVAGAIDATEAQRSLHWSCARTQLNFDLLGELEETLSEMFCARVVAFSSVMLANLGAIPILASGQLTGGRKPVIVFDGFAHVTLACHQPVADETRVKTIAHNDISALERLCRENPVVAYICEGVCAMGDYSPIKELRQLQERYGLFLYIDDTHGISIFGRQGEGFARSQFPRMLGEKTIIAASLANGFGASGGMLMLGSTSHEALFRRYSIPDASSMAPSLPAVGAALGSCKIHRSVELSRRQERLAQRIDLFDRRLATAGQGNSLPIRMVAIRSEASAIAIARALFDVGFHTLVTFFRTVGLEKAGIRVCITAEHEARDIERLCDCILQTVAEMTGKPYPLR